MRRQLSAGPGPLLQQQALCQSPSHAGPTTTQDGGWLDPAGALTVNHTRLLLGRQPHAGLSEAPSPPPHTPYTKGSRSFSGRRCTCRRSRAGRGAHGTKKMRSSQTRRPLLASALSSELGSHSQCQPHLRDIPPPAKQLPS